MDENLITPEPVTESDSFPNPDVPLSDNLQGCLKDILRICENEDQGVYWAMVQKWARLEYYFNNIIALFWDASYAGGQGGWRIPDWDSLTDDEDFDMPPRIVAIYRAHAEAIIAALSVTVPSVVFFPDDAEDIADIESADAHSQIAALIQKHIKAPMIFMRALTILFNHGTIFGYNYYKRDKRFGQIIKPKMEVIEISEFDNNCQNCAYNFGLTAEPILEPIQCPQCLNTEVPFSDPINSQMEIQTGVDKIDKGRVCIDLFDPRSAKVSIYAKEQANCGYLLLNFSQSVALIRAEFKDNKISSFTNVDSMDWARNAVQYYGAVPENVASVKCLWLRPWQFHCLGDGKAAEINELVAKYPEGCYAIFINDELKYIVEENLDEHWTISINPLSSFIHGEPLGTNLATVQDIQAEIDELRLQTVEHGIPETFTKPEVLDLDQYGQASAKPGMVTAVKGADPNKDLSSNFFQTKTATLSAEIEVYNKDLTQRAQFVTGSFPSIYGGALEGAGGTAYEYKKSNAQALQRLGITWKIVAEFWNDLITKATVEFVDFMEDDERYVEREGQAFKNINISREAVKNGNVSRSEAEFSDQLPVTWEQINQVISNLLQLQNPAIEAVLFNPENAELMKKALGLRDLHIPGADSRTKQIGEFIILSQSAPMGNMPSVIPDITDNHAAEAEVLANIINSPRGQKLKMENPVGFQNALLHWQAHMSMIPPPVEEGNNESKSGANDNAE